MRQAARLAMGTLTAWPVRPPSHVDAAVAGAAMMLAPLTAAPALALLGVVAGLGGWLGAPAALIATALTAGLALSSRGLHLDGLADTCDALASGHDRERSLAVMKRGDTGPAGVAALTLTLLLQVSALTALVGGARGLVLAAVGVVASRHVLAWGCRQGVGAARPDGLGAAVAGSVPPLGLGVGAATILAASLALSLWTGMPWWHGPVVALVGVAAGVALLARAVSRLGGMTGDVLGAMVEVALAASWAAAATLVG